MSSSVIQEIKDLRNLLCESVQGIKLGVGKVRDELTSQGERVQEAVIPADLMEKIKRVDLRDKIKNVKRRKLKRSSSSTARDISRR